MWVPVPQIVATSRIGANAVAGYQHFGRRVCGLGGVGQVVALDALYLAAALNRRLRAVDEPCLTAGQGAGEVEICDVDCAGHVCY